MKISEDDKNFNEEKSNLKQELLEIHRVREKIQGHLNILDTRKILIEERLREINELESLK